MKSRHAIRFSGALSAILARVDDTGTAYYVFHGADGGSTTVAGEPLEWMLGEASRRGIALEEFWKEMTGQVGERIWRRLNKQ